MPDTIACPQCGRQYPFKADWIGRQVRCKNCGNAFRVVDPIPRAMPAAPAVTAGGAPRSTGIEGEVWSELLDDVSHPSEAAALSSVHPRRRRMSDADKVFLGLGVALAIFGLGLLVLLAIFGVANGFAMAAGLLLGMAGVGMAALALRSNPVAATVTGAGLSCTVLLAAVLQPRSSDVRPAASASDRSTFESAPDQDTPGSGPEEGSFGSAFGSLLSGSSTSESNTPEPAPDRSTPEPAPRRPSPGPKAPPVIPPFAGEKSQAPVTRMTALVHLLEAIRDESSLRVLEPRILKLFGEMLDAAASGGSGNPWDRADVKQALPQYDQRMAAGAARLEAIPGGLELRRKLVKLVKEKPIPSPPWDDEVELLPTIASWVVWGWVTPPPPESSADRARRESTVKAAGRKADGVRVYVRGITTNAMGKKVSGKILAAAPGIVMGPPSPSEVCQYQTGKVEDFREVAYRLDIGPIVKIEANLAILHVQLDRSELFERPREFVAGPIPLLDFQKAGISPASSVALPEPPEPQHVKDRRADARWDFEGNLKGIDLVLHNSDDELNRLVSKRIMAMKLAKGLRSQNLKFGPKTIHCDDIGDMRAFARKLDVGTIFQYDDRKGVIGVVVDRSRLIEPPSYFEQTGRLPEPPEPDDVRQRRRIARTEGKLPPDDVQVMFLGISEDQAKDMPQRLMAAKLCTSIGWNPAQTEERWFNLREVGDIRVFAQKIELGKIVEYDERMGRIVIEPDMAKLSVPPPELPVPTPPKDAGNGFDPRKPPVPRFGPRSGRSGSRFSPRGSDP